MASISESVWRRSVIENAPAPAAGGDDLLHPDHGEEIVPAGRPVNVIVEILLHAADRIAVDLRHISVEMVHHRLIDAVALVRRRAERHLDHGIDAEEGDPGLIRPAADLSLETIRSVVRITRFAAIARSMSMNCSPSICALP